MTFCLGTANLGMRYGIRNDKCFDVNEGIQLLEKAVAAYDVVMIDTAESYGMAEQIIGMFNDKNPQYRHTVSVVTKFTLSEFGSMTEKAYFQLMIEHLHKSIDRLRVEQLDGYLLHASSHIFNSKIIHALNAVKKTGMVKNIGVSIYEPAEALAAAKNPYIDYIQVPYNALDRRLEHNNFFEIAKKNGKKIFCRSIFLQGLLTMNTFPIESAMPYISKFQDISNSKNMHYDEACVKYVLANNNIDYMVMGVDSIKELQRNVRLINMDTDIDLVKKIKAEICCVDRNILNPSLWKKRDIL